MEENNDFLDELNWYTQDFVDSPPPLVKKEGKKERKTLEYYRPPARERADKGTGSDHHRRINVAKRKVTTGVVPRRREETSVPATRRRDVSSVNVVPSRRDEGPRSVPDPRRTVVKRKETDNIDIAYRKIVRPDEDEPKQGSVVDKSALGVSGVLVGKLRLLEERDRSIRSGLEKESDLKRAGAVRGTCPDMCPEKERIMRCVQKMVSVYECGPGSNEMEPAAAVKEYARSSADQEEPLPHELRPEPVLTMTMAYMVTRVIARFEECEDTAVWYDFCWNRLRAVRKDIVQQQLCDPETVIIVEQCARFHIVCFDRFWGADSSVFDEKINTENLMNCLKILINLYSDLRKRGRVCPNEPEFNAYMILIKLNSGDLLWEYLNFPLSLQRTPEVIEAVKIHTFYNGNMYSQYFNYLVRTSYLNACLMQRFFTNLRVNGLEAMVRAYCPPNKQGKISLHHVMKSLKLDCKEDAVEFCSSCGIKYTERVGFRISHGAFSRPDIAHRVRTPSSLVLHKRVDFAQAVVGVDNDLPTYIEHTVHNSFVNEKTLHPDASDASDQEEKMLRDDVERKLLLRNLQNSSGKEGGGPSPAAGSLRRSLSSLSRKSGDSDTASVKVAEEPVFPTEMETEELSDSEDYDLPDTPTQYQGAASELYSPHSDRDEPLPLLLASPEVSPLSALSEEEEDEELDEDLTIISVPEDKPVQRESPPSVAVLTSPVGFRSTPAFVPESPPGKRDNLVLTSPKPAERRLSVCSTVEKRPDPGIVKLVNDTMEKVRRILARKYGRVWRERVKEIKRSYGFTPRIHHVDMADYLQLWGHAVTKHNSIIRQLDNSEKLRSAVDSLLEFDSFDAASARNVSFAVFHSLAESKLRHDRLSGNVGQPGAVYWKLVVSVPESREPRSDLYGRVLSWSRKAFFSSDSARDSGVETTICKGVKVYIKVQVLKGCRHLESGRNLSALMAVRVPGWETQGESQARLDSLLLLTNHPIPVCVVDLAPPESSLVPPPRPSVLFFSEYLAGTKTHTDIFTDLSTHSYQMTVKSLRLCYLVEEILDKFLDALQGDCHVHRGFHRAMRDPRNVVTLYNEFVLLLKTEIVRCYRSNVFGTANEIISRATPWGTDSAPPPHLEGYLDGLRLKPLVWPPGSPGEVLSVFRSYCEAVGTPEVLTRLIRTINPPDEPSALPGRLLALNWLRVMEIIIKARLRNHTCDTLVTYSQTSIDDLVDSHWWMSSPPILKYINSFTDDPDIDSS